MSDPFGQLRYDSSTTRSHIPIRTEKDLDHAEKERRERYISGIKSRHLGADVGRIVSALKKSVVKEAVIETSKGTVKRDPLCVYTRPIYDEATCLAYAHTDEVINLARKKCAVIDLGYNLATRENLERVFTALKPIRFVHCGHGTENAFLGQDGERIIDSNNVSLLQGCLVSAMACHSHNIAVLAIERGCLCFNGFKGSFRVMSDYTVARLILRRLRQESTLTPDGLQSAKSYAADAVKSALIHDRDNTFTVGETQVRIASFGDIDRQKYCQLMR